LARLLTVTADEGTCCGLVGLPRLGWAGGYRGWWAFWDRPRPVARGCRARGRWAYRGLAEPVGPASKARGPVGPGLRAEPEAVGLRAQVRR
jgi:hypothetical protein